VVASAGIATRLAALIPLCIAQPICLGIEQGVQRLLHGATTRSRWLLIRSSSIVMSCSADSVYRLTWRLPLAGLGAFRHFQFSQIRGRQPYSIVRKIPYLIPAIVRQSLANA